MKDKKVKKVAYEFKDNLSLKAFLNKLYLNYYEDGLDLSGLYKDALFNTASQEHPVYVLTILTQPVYELTDSLTPDVEIINKGNIQKFINSLEQ